MRLQAVPTIDFLASARRNEKPAWSAAWMTLLKFSTVMHHELRNHLGFSSTSDGNTIAFDNAVFTCRKRSRPCIYLLG